MHPKISNKMTDFPVCPHCGHVEQDAWEIDFGPGLDGDTHHWCGSCGKEYYVERLTTVYYSTTIVDATY